MRPINDGTVHVFFRIRPPVSIPIAHPSVFLALRRFLLHEIMPSVNRVFVVNPIIIVHTRNPSVNRNQCDWRRYWGRVNSHHESVVRKTRTHSSSLYSVTSIALSSLPFDGMYILTLGAFDSSLSFNFLSASIQPPTLSLKIVGIH